MQDIQYLQKEVSSNLRTVNSTLEFKQDLNLAASAEELLDQIIVKYLFTTQGADKAFPSMGVGVQSLMATGGDSKGLDNVRVGIADAVTQLELQILDLQSNQGYPPEATLKKLRTHPDKPINYIPSSDTWIIPLLRETVAGRVKPITLTTPGNTRFGP
jgi:hypothetical protein